MPEMNGIELLEKFLKLTSQRQQTVVTNMANVDTPKFRTRDIDFRSELTRAVNNQETPASVPMLRQVSGLIARPDGNNVNLDREGTLLAETQMQFQIGVQLIRGEFRRLMTAINGGGGSSQ
jgi:flagellar basal-body rod protein FlgB